MIDSLERGLLLMIDGPGKGLLIISGPEKGYCIAGMVL